MDKKQSGLVVVVASILLVVAIVWLFVINFDGKTKRDTDIGTPEAQMLEPKSNGEESFETFELEDFSSDFSELDQLQQDINDVNIEEDIIPTL